ncbi:gliding motility-associated C-terminal domain-containing protein [Flavobacterium psychrophilum]|uniref:T9SS type B sorting domain-containing protein n=1 Tax=Flavobacterium psychrophilum TaxID=96345 RepID=UPI00106B05DF|nr:gliding motility-associated C-terminal domain-containing protein [Flavobacterium psychrophilum]
MKKIYIIFFVFLCHFVHAQAPNTSGITTFSSNTPTRLCINTTPIVTVSSSLITNGLYSIIFSVNGVSTLTSYNVNFVNGIAIFPLGPGNPIWVSSGVRTIGLISIKSNVTFLSSTFPTTINDITYTQSLYNLNESTGGTTIVGNCAGESPILKYTSTADPSMTGQYRILYDLLAYPNYTTISTNMVSPIINIVNGSGSCILNNMTFSAGNYSLRIKEIRDENSTCSQGMIYTTLPFIIKDNPNITGNNNINTNNICIGQNATISINSSLLVNETYNLTYNLSGANTHLNVNVQVQSINGQFTFTIPSNLLSNKGVTNISIESISNTYYPTLLSSTLTSTCKTTFNISTNFNVVEYPNLSGSNSLVVEQTLCPNVPARITLNSSLLSNGTYNLVYSLSGSNTLSNQNIAVNFTGGVGNFIVPVAQIPNLGTTTIKILSLQSTIASCMVSAPTRLLGNFTIFPLPNLSGSNSLVVEQPLCPNVPARITLNSSLLSNGTYNLVYSLSGSNTLSNQSIAVNFTGGIGNFIVPVAQIPNTGTTIIKVLSLQNTTGLCSEYFPSTIEDTFIIDSYIESSIESSFTFCIQLRKKLKDIGSKNIQWLDNNLNLISEDSILESGNYYYNELSINHCASENKKIEVIIEKCEMIIPTAFTPNNDGINDTYNILNISYDYPNYTMEIQNRYGKNIYSGKNGWNGAVNNIGEILENGVYFMSLNYNDLKKENTNHTILIQK